MTRLDGEVQVDALVDGANASLFRSYQSHLERIGFAVDDTRNDERLLPGPDGQVFLVSYSLSTSVTDRGDRFVRFCLRSEIPHVSTIVAAIGVPHPGAEIPLFVMNLNLKPRLCAYNTVLGFRGPAAYLDRLQRAWPGTGIGTPTRLLEKPPPPSFVGVRAVFRAHRDAIDWSLGAAGRAADAWFLALGEAADRGGDGSLSEYVATYGRDMLALHQREGNVFDAIFGDGWALDLFRRHVFTHLQE